MADSVRDHSLLHIYKVEPYKGNSRLTFRHQWPRFHVPIFTAEPHKHFRRALYLVPRRLRSDT